MARRADVYHVYQQAAPAEVLGRLIDASSTLPLDKQQACPSEEEEDDKEDGLVAHEGPCAPSLKIVVLQDRLITKGGSRCALEVVDHQGAPGIP